MAYSGSYNPNVDLIQNHTVNLSKNLDVYSSNYENVIVKGDFNAEMTNNYWEEFCASYNFKNLIKQPTCFKNPDNPTLIDHILTNHPKSFHSLSVYEIGLSEFHKLPLTVLKTFHVKHKPKIIRYRDFSHFDNASFRADLLQNHLRKMFCLENLKNLNTFPRKSSIFMLLYRKNMLDVTNLPS